MVGKHVMSRYKFSCRFDNNSFYLLLLIHSKITYCDLLVIDIYLSFSASNVYKNVRKSFEFSVVSINNNTHKF